MTKKALFLACLAVAGLAGACAQIETLAAPGKKSYTQEPVSAALCTASPCTHVVTVDESQSPCKVVLDPEVMIVHRIPDALVVWELKAPGYKFESITFKDQDTSSKEFTIYRKRARVPSKDQFRDQHVNATKADVTDVNSADGSWLYNVVVRKGDKTCAIDPPIINDY